MGAHVFVHSHGSLSLIYFETEMFKQFFRHAYLTLAFDLLGTLDSSKVRYKDMSDPFMTLSSLGDGLCEYTIAASESAEFFTVESK